MLFLSGVQQNPSSRVIWPSEKSLPLTDPLNSHHKKKLRLDDSLSGDYILLKHPLEARWASRSPLSEPSTLLPSLSICPSFISSTLAPQWPPPLGEGTRERQPLGLWGKLGWGRPQGLLGWRLQVLLSPSLSVSLLCHPLWCLQMKQMKKLLLRFSTVWSVCVCVLQGVARLWMSTQWRWASTSGWPGSPRGSIRPCTTSLTVNWSTDAAFLNKTMNKKI